ASFLEAKLPSQAEFSARFHITKSRHTPCFLKTRAKCCFKVVIFDLFSAISAKFLRSNLRNIQNPYHE
ncbi:MAG: hypothetical protein WC726_02780, partial [Parcubacteria group bacterium]